jgi:hypothetical protein
VEKINWPEVIEEEKYNLQDAFEALFNEACCLNANSEICQVVKLNANSSIIHYTAPVDSISSAVWTGDAIELARMAWFNPLDDADHEEVIQAYLTKEELQNFSNFLNGEKPSLAKLRQWNVATADRLEKKFTENYVAEHAPAWAAKKMEEIWQKASEYGREETRKEELDDLGKS